MTITGAQVKAARELLGWTQRRLAAKAGVSDGTISRTERDCDDRPNDWMKIIIQQAFEEVGVIFIKGKGGAGVRLRKGK